MRFNKKIVEDYKVPLGQYLKPVKKTVKKETDGQRIKQWETLLGRRIITEKQYKIYRINTILLLGIFFLLLTQLTWFNMSFEDKEINITVELENNNAPIINVDTPDVPVQVDNYFNQTMPEINIEVEIINGTV